MKMYHLYLLMVCSFLSFHTLAQAKPAATAKPVPSQTKPGFTSASDSIKYAINDFKSSMNNLFGSRKDTIAFIIANVDYDDINVEALKENLKKWKGVHYMGMQFKNATAKIECTFKGKPTDLWDEMPVEIKKAFRITEAGDNNLLLSNRTPAKQ